MNDLIIYDPIGWLMSMAEELEDIGVLGSQRKPAPPNSRGGS